MPITIQTGGPSEFDHYVDQMKNEIKEAVAKELILGDRPIEDIHLAALKQMFNDANPDHYAVIRLTVEFRKKDWPDA